MATSGSRPIEQWKEFGRQWEWGRALNGKESKKDKEKRLKEVSGRKQQKKKKQQIYNQTDLKGNNISLQDAEEFGDGQKTKGDNMVRIGLQNMQLLPESAKHYKSRQSVDHIQQREYDAFLMTEPGLCWPKLAASDQWFERALAGKLHDSYATFAYNDQ
jgi:hypothetical protein